MNQAVLVTTDTSLYKMANSEKYSHENSSNHNMGWKKRVYLVVVHKSYNLSMSQLHSESMLKASVGMGELWLTLR